MRNLIVGIVATDTASSVARSFGGTCGSIATAAGICTQ
jgi:hypothetical protein